MINVILKYYTVRNVYVNLHEHNRETFIQWNNVNYSKYILEQSIRGNIRFTFTSSRSYVIPNTNIKLGVLKAYPMSVFLDYKEMDKILKEINKTIDEYSKIDISKYDKKTTISDDMVYRERKWLIWI